MSLARDLFDRTFFPDRDVHAIPVLDGGFSPNERLDHAEQRGPDFVAPDDLLLGRDDRLYVSSGNTVFVCASEAAQSPQPFAQFESKVGALGWSDADGLLIGIAGRGVCAVDAAGKVTARIEKVDKLPILCPTAIAVASDGTIFVSDGSRHNKPGDWLQDLMQQRPGSGRLIACQSGLSNPRVLVEGLSWPSGLVVSHGEHDVLVAEAWKHCLTAYPRAGGIPRPLVKNFAGYPARIVRGANRDYWLAFFALRTQLTEFVLRERGFRERMMERVPPELWIGPSLGGTFDYREPNQIGRIKKLGIQKPWAPPRSYGLVARMDENGQALESFHSRTSGKLHGITSVQDLNGRILMASKGHGKIAEMPTSAQAQGIR
jgi:Strictosidine synthase